jgi:hypothetical protein
MIFIFDFMAAEYIFIFRKVYSAIKNSPGEKDGRMGMIPKGGVNP